MSQDLPSASARRVVTFRQSNGHSTIHANTAASRVTEYKHVNGMQTSILWATEPGAPLPVGYVDPVPGLTSLHPMPGGSVFMTITLPPDAVYLSPGFDPVAAAAEQAAVAPGLAELFEADAPGFHTTDTIDYVIVLDGEIWLETDSEEIRLQAHDVVVQNGTRHAWRNHGSRSATLAVVLMGAVRRSAAELR
jgi:mannose-6-phosphate isomerase-like protein (cupin superfamily)